MTRVVVVNHYPVLPVANGGQEGVYGMTLEFAREWPTELVWAQRKTQRSFVHEDRGVEVRISVVPNLWRQRHLARFLRHWLGSIEGDIGSMLCSGANRALIGHLLAACADGDVIVLEHPWLWPAVREVLRRRRALFVYDAHNVEIVLKSDSLQPGAVSRRVLARVRALEAEVVRRADLVLATTPLDAESLQRISGRAASAFLVAGRGGVAPERSQRSAAAHAGRTPGRSAVFVGARHPPNDAAAKWIIESLAPGLPDWRFDIAGACGPACGATPSTDNVRVLGFVPDLADLLDEADVALNPITFGSGINMKVLEYLQYGLPVVSTPFGARGLSCERPNGVVVAELEGFAAALQEVVATAPRYRELSAQAIAAAQERFGWTAVGRRVRARIAELLAAPRPRSPGQLG